MNISDSNNSISNHSFDRARVYTDFAGLNELTAKGNENSEEALREVARQFESIFLGIALKSMRSANEAFSKDGYFSSNESSLYQDMLDKQLSLTMSQGSGMGLAQSLYKQLSQYLPDSKNDALPTNAKLDLKI